MYSVGAEARLSPKAGVETRLGARVQQGRLTDLDADIPYVAPWAVEGLVSVAFAGKAGLIQATTEILGPRDADVAGTLEVDMHADLDVRLSYEFGGGAIASFELRNLLGETPYWLNYPEPPATLVLGLGWRW